MNNTHPKQEETFVLIKHDGVQRSLIGEIIGRIERTGLKITALRMVWPTIEQAREHYGKDDEWCEKVGNRTIENITKKGGTPDKTALLYGKEVLEGLYKYLSVAPVIILVVQGNQAVGIVKKLVGGTEPLTSDVGTIRGDLTVDSYEIANVDNRAVRNLIHCSDAVDEAQREIKIWFGEGDVHKYRLFQEAMLYDVNLDGIKE